MDQREDARANEEVVRNSLDRFIANYFGEAINLRQRIYYVSAVLGILTGIASILTNVLIPGNTKEATLSAVFCWTIVALVSLYGFWTKRHYKACFVTCFLISWIGFPIAFFCTGGINGGVPFYFLMMVYTMVLSLKTRDRNYLVTGAIIIDVLCCVVAVIYPEGVISITPESRVVHVLSGFVDAALFGLVETAYVFREYSRESRKAKEMLHMMEQQAGHDELTQLYNRRYLMDYLEAAFVTDKNFYLAIFDIDNFKSANDTYGHLFGDEVLIRFSEFMKVAVGKNNISARYGGEEFIMVIWEQQEERVLELLENIRRSMEYAHWRQNKQLKITVSAGVECRQNVKNVAELIEMADSKLYQAKRGGKNRIVR
ncbi:MAG: GGDEF domain-containing protein [Lachnospiraceae bacterium]|nr:GGDEF domain-containing protein [Lachnospiraceae bacterium]